MPYNKEPVETNRNVVKKFGRRKAGSYGRTSKCGKRMESKAVRRQR